MKHLVIIHHVSNVGGGTISLVDMCKMLCEKFKITVVIPKKNSERLSEMLEGYAEVVTFNTTMPQIAYYSGSGPIFSRRFFSSFAVPKKDIESLVGIISDLNPDIILANSMIQCRMGKYLKNVKAKKYIYIRETFCENIFSKPIVHYINKYFDGVICISPYEAGYAKLKIPYAVVADCFDEYSSKSDRPVVLPEKSRFRLVFLGGGAPIKGLGVLLSAMNYVKSDAKLVICGNLSLCTDMKGAFPFGIGQVLENRRLKNLLEKYKDKIICTGFVSDTGSVINQCDALVFPSTVPHQSRPAIEAGRYSKPVIISDFPQTACYYRNEENCLVFKPNSPKSLAAAIDRLSSDRSLCIRLGENNHISCQKQHCFEKEKQKLKEFIDLSEVKHK